LGKLGPKAVGVAPTLANLLADTTAVADPERAFFRLHVVEALGKMGSGAIGVVPALIRAKGDDPTVDKAIDAAIDALLKAPPPKPQDQPPKPPQPPVPAPIDALIGVLKDDKADALPRMIAARALRQLAGGLSADQKKAATDAAAGAQKSSDNDLQCVAKNLSDALK
ncbi:MAG TPA: hypothetical protein VFW33_10930, partial [Gemmataceae bacterium]|nr:hypothetical protein [Gemmataceae bacterium]